MAGVEQVIRNLENIARDPPKDEDLREGLYNAAQKLLFAVESQHDTVYRILYSVRAHIPIPGAI